MDIPALLVAGAAVVLATTALSDRLRFPAPLLLILVGVATSYLPFVPTVHLHAEVVLLGLLPPLLYSAAISTSLIDFNANRGSILRLSVVLVVLTALAVGALVQWLVPGLGWAAAIAIGAVVAPPDAVAATAVARRIGLPRRVVTILEGESLLNDASALVTLRTSIAAVAGGFSLVGAGLDFLLAAGGGTVVGVLGFVTVAWLRRHLTDPVLDTGLSFLIPFATFLTAEHFHASGVIAVVVAGLLLGHKAPHLQTARSRITERITWGTVAFVLENAVFLLIGLQLEWILRGAARSTLSPGRIALVCVATLVMVIGVRLVWVFASTPLRSRADSRMPASWTFLIGWAGMRGVVTLAAAFLIPEHTPYREVLLLVAFTVVAGTLFLQGLTLPLLTRWLKVQPPDPALDALAQATLLQAAADAGLRELDETRDDPHSVRQQIHTRLEQRGFAAWEMLSTAPGEESPSQTYIRVRLGMLQAERDRVLQIRDQGGTPSEVVGRVLAMLDVEESMLDSAVDNAGMDRRSPVTFSVGQQCPELIDHPAGGVPPQREECPECVEEGTRAVALRTCLSCGHVGCCDSSVGRHATAHFRETGHPVMQSAEPGENWRWCYVHNQTG